jgi:hypothetical protein
MAMAVPDAETMVVQYLTGALDGLAVATDMPAGYGKSAPIAPFVWINALPGNYVQKTWQGRTLMWMVTLDYDGFDTDHDGNSARYNALQVARQVCDALMRMNGYESDFGRVTRVEVYTPSVRPDWNDKIRRYGSTTQVWARAATG